MKAQFITNLQLTSSFDQPELSSKDETSLKSPVSKSLQLKEEDLEPKIEKKEEVIEKIEPGKILSFSFFRKTNFYKSFCVITKN